MSTLKASAIFCITVMETFLSPFSMPGMYVRSKSAVNASFSCDQPLSVLSNLTLLPNFFLISISKGYAVLTTSQRTTVYFEI
jgi:hypothetical protein